MSLAFAALAVAINGSTRSRATLSFGLYGIKASSASVRRRQDSHRSGCRRKPSESLSCDSLSTKAEVVSQCL
jgi:hypothetical protein